MKMPKMPKGPELKLGRKKDSGDSGGGSPQMPDFVNELYRDMRDRRLLVPAVALLVAILAVPMLLKADSSPAPTSVPAAQEKGLLSMDPAVTPETLVGVRDYKQRLAALQQQNPFKSPFKTPTDPLTDPTASPTDTGAVSDPTAVPGGSTDTTTPTAPTSPTTPTDPNPDPSGDYFVAPQVDVRMGAAGDVKDYKGVNLGDLLPSKNNPLAMFIGVPSDLSRAQFLLSRDVVSVSGAGQCQGSGCEFLTLRKGEIAYLVSGADGQEYQLKLNSIKRVVVDKNGNPVGG